MQVTNLFVKRHHGSVMDSVVTISHGTDGIRDNVACAPFRQVLIASQSVMAECDLRPGDLRENIVVDFDRLYDLASGTVVKIGTAMIRLTFHCEPCKTILKLVDFDRIEHKRGVLGCFLNSGSISIGDEFGVTDICLEPIPYAVHERIRWFLKHQNMPGAATDVMHKIGLPASAAKLMSRIMLRRRFEPRVAAPLATTDAEI